MKNREIVGILPKGLVDINENSILVIDDDASMLLLNRAILEEEGYRVFTAKSGSEAFILLADIAMPNLILLDMRMEGMSGPDFILELEKKRPDILQKVPIVFLTAMDRVPVTKASGFIKKPMDIDCFLNDISRYIVSGVREQAACGIDAKSAH